MSIFWLLPIGVLAGILTTVTGVGGGMVALSLLSLVMAPAVALAITAAAFAVGNGHRALMFARSIDRRVTLRFGSGLAAGALGGALLVPRLPEVVLRGALIAVAMLAVGKVLMTRRRERRHRELHAATSEPQAAPWPGLYLATAGLVVGAIGAGAGGAGVMVSPLLLSTGLRREPYVATVASCAIVLNSFRVVGYGLGGLYHLPMLLDIAALAATLVVGNLLGKLARQALAPTMLDRLELGAPLLAIVIALLGV